MSIFTRKEAATIERDREPMAMINPRRVEAPSVPTAVARRKLSEHAANVAQDIIDLENERDTARKDADHWMHTAARFEQLQKDERDRFDHSLQIERRRNEALSLEKNFYQRRCSALVNQLRASATIIVEALNADDSVYQPEASERKQDGQLEDAMKKQITTDFGSDDGKPSPQFLHQNGNAEQVDDPKLPAKAEKTD